MLMISDELQDALNDEGITRDVIEQAFEKGLRDGAVVFDEESGCFSTHAAMENVTLWVKYRTDGERDEVVDAYCHRIKVIEQLPEGPAED